VAVWVVLDESCDVDEIASRLAELIPQGDLDYDDLASAVEMLAELEVIVPR